MTVESDNLANPYPGLRSFTSDEGDLFFGRDRQKNELLRRLKRHRFLAVVGTSGSGKSSLIRAGLIPTLRNGLRTRAGSGWQIVVMKPGNNPIGHLAAALGETLGPHDLDPSLCATFNETTLRRSALGLIEAVRQTHLTNNLLILIDQFEELFRIEPDPNQSEPEDQAAAFVRLFLEAAKQEDLPIYVLITLRSDFLGDCAKFMGLPEAINKSEYLVPRLDREERRQVIVGPANLRGVEITPRLLHRVLNDVGDNPDQLPILQHALMRTWDYWQQHHKSDEPLDLPQYEAIGTMAEALERHADEAYNELAGSHHQQVAEKLFKRLTEKGKDNRETRHPTILQDICAVTEASEEVVNEVVSAFRCKGRSFLMPPPETALHADILLDISHESLIRVWGRLRDWVAEEAESRRKYRGLVERALLFSEGKDTYLENPALQIALDWYDEDEPNKAWALRYHPKFDTAMAFLSQSRAEYERKRAEEELARREKLERIQALAEERKQRLEEQRKATKRLRWLAAALAVVFGVAVWAAFDARTQKQLAEKQARFSAATERAMVAMNHLTTDPELSTLLALEAVLVTYAVDEIVTPQAQNALNHAVQEMRMHTVLEAHPPGVSDVAFTANGSYLVSGGKDGTIIIWDTVTRKRKTPISITGSAINDIALRADGRLIAAAHQNGTVTLWDVTGERLHTLRGHQGAVNQVAFSPAGTHLASGGKDATIRLWDPSSGQLRHTLQGHTEAVVALAFHPGGFQLAAASWDNTISLWHPATGQRLHSLTGHTEAVVALVFNVAGSQLATASWDKTIRLWNPDDGQLQHILNGHEAAVVALAYNPSGDYLASGGWDATMRLWNPHQGVLVRTFGSYRNTVNIVAFSPTANRLAGAGRETAVQLWDLSKNQPWYTLTGHNDWINAMAFSPDGTQIATAGDDGLVVFSNVRGTEVIGPLSGYESWETSLALSEKGYRLAAIIDGQVQVLNPLNGEVLYGLTGHRTPVRKVAFSIDGERVATVTANRIREYYLDIDALIAEAKRLVTRPLTPTECKLFLHLEPCPPSGGSATAPELSR